MKKNLFLLLSIYAFVLQPLLAAILRLDIVFCYMAGINFVLILVISWLYYAIHGITPAEKTLASTRHDKKIALSPGKQVKNVKIQDVSEVIASFDKENKDCSIKSSSKNSISKNSSNSSSKKSFKIILLWIVFFVTLVWMGITYLYLSTMFTKLVSGILAILSGYLWFWVLIMVFAIYDVRNLFFIIYRYVLLVLLLAGTGFLIYTDLSTSSSYINDFYVQTKNYLNQFFDRYESEEAEISTGQIIDLVINTGEVHFDSMFTGGILSGSVGTGLALNTGINEEVESGMVTDIVSGKESHNSIVSFPEGKPLTLLMAVKYLIDTFEVPLDTKKNIFFKYLSINDQNYTYFNTAYAQKLIGKNTKPDALISCDIYIVMKGILSKWEVGQYTDIKKAYWNKARQLDVLHGCVQGANVLPSML